MNNIKQKILRPLHAYTTTQLIVGFFIFWTPVILFAKLAGEVVENQPIGFDLAILHWIHSLASPILDSVFLFFTTIGNVEVLLPITGIITAYLFYKKRRRDALIVIAGVGGAAAANFILKILFHRDRPAFWHSLVTETGYSFPSGHAMLSSALLLCFIAIVWNTRWRLAAIIGGGIVVLMIGLSRLYMGVHYPTDIIAGWSVSFIWVAIVVMIVKKITVPRTGGTCEPL
jgi:membrane-associated phospholipid phosphatase